MRLDNLAESFLPFGPDHMPEHHQDTISPLSIDCVIFGFEEAKLKVLLIRRKIQPEQGKWALPGGFILYTESINDASRRILEELTGVSNIYLEQLQAFGEVNRYPGERVVTIAYYALIKPSDYPLVPGLETSGVDWMPIHQLPELPFDHAFIIQSAHETLQQKVRHQPIGFELLPEKFTLSQLQELYEATLDIQLDKPNFRRKFMRMNLLVPSDEYLRVDAHRPARLYRFDKKHYDRLIEQGLNFEV